MIHTTEPVLISKRCQNSSEFELDCKNNKEIIGFKIKLPSSNEEDVKTAYQKAHRFTNFLSFRTGMHIFHERPYVEGDSNLSLPSHVKKEIDLNVTDNNLIELLENDSIRNQMLAHFAAGLRALDDKVFSTAITEFYQTVEVKEKDKESFEKLYNESFEKCKCIRAGLSHHELTYDKTIDCLEKFNFPLGELSSGKKHMDLTSQDVKDYLEKYAQELKKEVQKFLDNYKPSTAN